MKRNKESTSLHYWVNNSEVGVRYICKNNPSWDGRSWHRSFLCNPLKPGVWYLESGVRLRKLFFPRRDTPAWQTEYLRGHGKQRSTHFCWQCHSKCKSLYIIYTTTFVFGCLARSIITIIFLLSFNSVFWNDDIGSLQNLRRSFTMIIVELPWVGEPF